jgi:hypothetical protein
MDFFSVAQLVTNVGILGIAFAIYLRTPKPYKPLNNRFNVYDFAPATCRDDHDNTKIDFPELGEDNDNVNKFFGDDVVEPCFGGVCPSGNPIKKRVVEVPDVALYARAEACEVAQHINRSAAAKIMRMCAEEIKDHLSEEIVDQTYIKTRCDLAFKSSKSLYCFVSTDYSHWWHKFAETAAEDTITAQKIITEYLETIECTDYERENHLPYAYPVGH